MARLDLPGRTAVALLQDIPDLEPALLGAIQVEDILRLNRPESRLSSATSPNITISTLSIHTLGTFVVYRVMGKMSLFV